MAGLVDQDLSRQLRASYAEYQASLGLEGRDGFGILTADNYDGYLMRHYLLPSAKDYLTRMEEAARREYLAAHAWIVWDGFTAAFTFGDYVSYVGRMKGLPAFDDFALAQPEPAITLHPPPACGTAGAMSAAIAVVEALKKTGGDTSTNKLIATMEGMSFQTPKGTMTFRKEDHQAMQDMYHFRIKNDPAFAWGVPELVRVIPAAELQIPITNKR